MSNNIEEKVVVITGASSGLGEATARYPSPGLWYPKERDERESIATKTRPSSS
jgi:hypothetical protein